MCVMSEQGTGHVLCTLNPAVALGITTLPYPQPLPSAMPVLTPCVIPLVSQPQPQPLRGTTPFRCFGLDALVHSLLTAEPMPNLSKQEATIEQTSSLLLACLSVFMAWQISSLYPHLSPARPALTKAMSFAADQQPVTPTTCIGRLTC